MGLKNQTMTVGELWALLGSVPADARVIASYKPANGSRKPIVFKSVKFDAQFPRTVELEFQP